GTFPERRPGRPKGGLYKTAIFYILFMIFQILAMYFATSIEGAIVFAMVPIFAKIIGRIILGERSTPLQMVFVVITVVALIVLVILNATSIELNVTGMIIMTVSSIFMGFQNVSARYIRGVFAPIEITAAISYLGTAVFVIASLVRGVAGGDFTFLIEPVTHPWFVIWASYLGVFCILLSAQFMSYMLAHMEIIQSTGFSTASTLVSIVAGAVILGEPLRWYHFVCGIVIMGGVIGLMTAPTKKENAGKSLGDEMAGGGQDDEAGGQK
ncbi:MAG: DMT family transporter, partial [Firmicutes bacterium]|nr:DMT family transporter [Bacillota bacterium]